MRKLIIAIGIAGGAVLSSPWTAQAQQYPPSTSTTAPTTTAPTTTTTAPADEFDVRAFGAVREGESFDKRDCGFQPGATVNVRFGDQAAGTATAGSDGCVQLRVSVRAGQLVDVNGRTFQGRCGENTIVVSGRSASGANRTITNRFAINCGASDTRAALLPRTGAGIAGVTAGGAVLIGAGVALVVAARRRRGVNAEA